MYGSIEDEGRIKGKRGITGGVDVGIICAIKKKSFAYFGGFCGKTSEWKFGKWIIKKGENKTKE